MRARALILTLLASGPAAAQSSERMVFDPIEIQGEVTRPSVAVERARPDFDIMRPDAGFVIDRLAARPVAFSPTGLHPGAMPAYLEWRRAGPQVEALQADSEAVRHTLHELLGAYRYDQVPADQLRVMPGLPMALEVALDGLTREHSAAMDHLDADALVEHARALVGEPGGLTALEQHVRSEWLRPLDVELEVLTIRRDAATEQLIAILEGAPGELTASQLLLLTDLRLEHAHIEWRQRAALHTLQSGDMTTASQLPLEPVVASCERFLAQFGEQHAMSPEIMYLLAWAQLQLGHTDSSQDVLARLIQADAGLVSDHARINLAEEYFRQQRYAEALAQYQAVLDSSQVPEHREIARYKIAWCHYLLNQHDEAQVAFLDLARDPPTDDVLAEAKHYLARSILEQADGDSTDLLTALTTWDDAHPNHTALRPDVWEDTAALAAAWQFPETADLYATMVEAWPEHPHAVEWLQARARTLRDQPAADDAATAAAYRAVLNHADPDGAWWPAQELLVRKAAHESCVQEAETWLAGYAYTLAVTSNDRDDYARAAEQLATLRRDWPDQALNGSVGVLLAASLTRLDRPVDALRVLREGGRLPEDRRCSKLELELRLLTLVPPSERDRPEVMRNLGRDWGEACLDRGSATSGLALTRAFLHAEEPQPADALLRAAWVPWVEDETLHAEVQPLIQELASLDPMVAADLCVDTFDVARRWQGCRLARREVGHRMLTGRKGKFIHLRHRRDRDDS